jgi:hypothetical protein
VPVNTIWQEVFDDAPEVHRRNFEDDLDKYPDLGPYPGGGALTFHCVRAVSSPETGCIRSEAGASQPPRDGTHSLVPARRCFGRCVNLEERGRLASLYCAS